MALQQVADFGSFGQVHGSLLLLIFRLAAGDGELSFFGRVPYGKPFVGGNGQNSIHHLSVFVVSENIEMSGCRILGELDVDHLKYRIIIS